MFSGEEMAPRSNIGNLVEIKISVPEGMLKVALEIMEEDGQKPGDGHRDLWISGFNLRVHDNNQILVNEKLRRRRAGESVPDDKDN